MRAGVVAFGGIATFVVVVVTGSAPGCGPDVDAIDTVDAAVDSGPDYWAPPRVWPDAGYSVDTSVPPSPVYDASPPVVPCVPDDAFDSGDGGDAGVDASDAGLEAGEAGAGRASAACVAPRTVCAGADSIAYFSDGTCINGTCSYRTEIRICGIPSCSRGQCPVDN